jgi:hypothetical protein
MVPVVGIRIACFLVLAACVACCQQQKETAMRNSLPDAPLPQGGSAAEAWADTFSGSCNLASQTVGSVNTLGKSHDRFLSTGWDTAYEGRANDGDELRRQLAALLRHSVSYQPSSQGSLMARATSAALGTFFRRDPSGKNRLNTSYLLGVLTSAVIHTAYRPYWNRPVSAPFGDFGSRVGNDASMNLLHEFRPSLEQLLKTHTPKFVSRIEASIGHK